VLLVEPDTVGIVGKVSNCGTLPAPWEVNTCPSLPAATAAGSPEAL